MQEEQREELGPPYDFRHNILTHKTTASKWNNMKRPDGRRQVIPFDRDIHFVPVEFLYHDPEMLRQYGERILIFNMHDPATREAFSTARETVNGYVLVSQPVSVELLEGVFDLEAGTWEFPYGPKCRPGLAEQYGVNDAEKLRTNILAKFMYKKRTLLMDWNPIFAMQLFLSGNIIYNIFVILEQDQHLDL